MPSFLYEFHVGVHCAVKGTFPLNAVKGEGTFVWWVCRAVRRCHSREGGWDTDVGRPSSI